MRLIVNFYVIDDHNIGDRLSAPLEYFEFPGFETIKVDIRKIDDFIKAYQNKLTLYDRIVFIIGGGGLLFNRFLESFQKLKSICPKASLIAWGIGQQIYLNQNRPIPKEFPYGDYLEGFDKVGIRDYEQGYSWIPCASCLNPLFDLNREIKHEFVVFSHKKFQIHINGLPRITNDSLSFQDVLDFLGSGETILTSSYHGAYWGTLLGRKVLAFPFSSKFYTLKHSLGLYPVEKWEQFSRKITLFGKTLYQQYDSHKFTCSIDGWNAALKNCQSYPNSLRECREQNQLYYAQILEFLQT